MARKLGSKNKNEDYISHYSKLPVEERLEFLARVIVDRIIADQTSQKEIIKRIGKKYEQSTSA